MPKTGLCPNYFKIVFSEVKNKVLDEKPDSQDKDHSTIWLVLEYMEKIIHKKDLHKINPEKGIKVDLFESMKRVNVLYEINICLKIEEKLKTYLEPYNIIVNLKFKEGFIYFVLPLIPPSL